jgi:hypothetical protein
MDGDFNMGRVKQAHRLRDFVREAGLGHIELLLLMVLARKMGKRLASRQEGLRMDAERRWRLWRPSLFWSAKQSATLSVA